MTRELLRQHCIPFTIADERPVAAAQLIARSRILNGDTVIDATVGNGNDTLFLTHAVGEGGHVHGFDIQAQAMDSTRAKLEIADLSNVTLHCASHARIGELVSAQIRVAMFNLGYLPGGDSEIITNGLETVAAIHQCLDLLLPNGVITIVIYTGHPGAAEEQDILLSAVREIRSRGFSTQAQLPDTANPKAPYLLSINQSPIGSPNK